MNLSRTVMSLLIVVLGFSIGHAQEPYRKWFQTFKGEWTYEWSSESGGFVEKGEVKSTIGAKRHALVSRVQNSSGDREIEIGGWQSQSKTLTFNGYSSNGGYWHVAYTELGDDRLRGTGYGVLPDGRAWKGKVVVTKKNDDYHEIIITGTADGKELISIGKFTRKQE